MNRTCTGCGTAYDADATSCPACGLGAGEHLPDLATAPPRPPQSAGRRSPERAIRRTSPRWRPAARHAGVLGLVVVVAGLGGYVALGQGHTDRSAPPTATSTDLRAGYPRDTSATGWPPSVVPPPGLARSAATRTSSGPTGDPATAARTPRSVDSTGDFSQPRGSRRIGPVNIAAALVHRPETAEVAGVLSDYFTAINTRDRAMWDAALVPSAGRNDAAWHKLRSTRDSQIWLLDVARDGDRVLATISFVSRQDPRLGPRGLRCARWSMLYTVVGTNGATPRIAVVHDSRVSSRAC